MKGAVMTSEDPQPSDQTQTKTNPDAAQEPAQPAPQQQERGGPKGPEPTRYGDWENNGRCTDF